MVLRNHGCVKIAYVYAATSLRDEMTKRCTAYTSTIWLPWITLLFLSDFVSWKVGRVSFASLTLQPFSKKYTGVVKLNVTEQLFYGSLGIFSARFGFSYGIKTILKILYLSSIVLGHPEQRNE